MLIDRSIYQTPLVTIGEFRCRAGHPLWRRENRIEHGPLLAFPRTPVQITHAGGEPTVATPNVVMLYNQHQIYRREALTPDGCTSEWFHIHPNALHEALREFGAQGADEGEAPFAASHARTETRTYLRQRWLYEQVRRDPNVDPLLVEECVLSMVREVFHGGSPQRRSLAVGSAPQRAHRRLAHDVAAVLGCSFRDKTSLSDIAQQVGASAYHLCRVFHREMGITIHRYLHCLRLRSALNDMTDSRWSLTQIALANGFASSSHLSDAFRRELRRTPSQIRDLLRGRSRSSKNMEAWLGSRLDNPD